MDAPINVTRREALRAIATGAALLGLEAIASQPQTPGQPATGQADLPPASQAVLPRTQPGIGNLYPQTNRHRQATPLDGIWKFTIDPKNEGEQKAYHEGLPGERVLAVPASWNEQANDLYHYQDRLWYQTEFYVPAQMAGKRIVLRFGCATFSARVFVNGSLVGEDDSAYLPFECDITGFVRSDRKNLLVVAVFGFPKPEQAIGRGDFYEYGGLSRSVYLCYLNACSLEDIQIDTSFRGQAGIANVEICADARAETAIVSIAGITRQVALEKGRGQIELIVPEVRPWCCENPHLYEVQVLLKVGTEIIDEYVLRTGFRTIEVRGRELLLNGKPIRLQGFGKHEDFHIIGRGTSHALNNRDMDLMKWVGANSFRTSHYPYAEAILDLADHYGILVISEAPFVAFDDKQFSSESLTRQSKNTVSRLVRRDRHHPSVIAWSIGNECNSADPKAAPFYGELIQTIRQTDKRPIMYVGWSPPEGDHVYGLVDIIGINRYYGWYPLKSREMKIKPGDIGAGIAAMDDCLERFAKLYSAPIFVTEFGADTVAGVHSMFAVQFSEEFQTRFLEEYIKLMASKSYVVGMHIWAFADFYTNQSVVRVQGNKKGLFTREREPKQAAFAVRRLWTRKEGMGIKSLNENETGSGEKDLIKVLGS